MSKKRCKACTIAKYILHSKVYTFADSDLSLQKCSWLIKGPRVSILAIVAYLTVEGLFESYLITNLEAIFSSDGFGSCNFEFVSEYASGYTGVYL